MGVTTNHPIIFSYSSTGASLFKKRVTGSVTGWRVDSVRYRFSDGAKIAAFIMNPSDNEAKDKILILTNAGVYVSAVEIDNNPITVTG